MLVVASFFGPRSKNRSCFFVSTDDDDVDSRVVKNAAKMGGDAHNTKIPYTMLPKNLPKKWTVFKKEATFLGDPDDKCDFWTAQSHNITRQIVFLVVVTVQRFLLLTQQRRLMMRKFVQFLELT